MSSTGAGKRVKRKRRQLLVSNNSIYTKYKVASYPLKFSFKRFI